MGADDRTDAVGGLLLALILGIAVAIAAPPPPSVPADLPARPPGVAAVALGWPISAECGDPAAWEALPRIGPARAAALAEHAAGGHLRAPPDLLQVPGIGIKMAALVAPRVAWTTAGPGAEEP